ncbi:hypothetical protein AC249_AIPGENE27435 [Exaiptasia diaphana]|nr:hypothetical protein AC249_AIPGENE27435 [Exaiptasia diaphana]
MKDISLYGSFSFPVEGEYAGGIIARSLCGAGKEMKKRVQLNALGGQSASVSGSTGTSINAYSSSTGDQQITDYCIRFIQHAPEPAVVPNIEADHVHPFRACLPQAGYAIKVGSGKRTTFSKEQKEVMIEFYDRQALHGIRAKPKEAQEVMEQRGLEVLTEKQIKSWWSTYHREKKDALNQEAVRTNTSAPLPSDSPTPSKPKAFLRGLQPLANTTCIHQDWQQALRNAMIQDNIIHEDIFDGDTVNVAVEEAVDIAGDECCVDNIESQYDVFGRNVGQELCTLFDQLAVVGQPSYNNTGHQPVPDPTVDRARAKHHQSSPASARSHRGQSQSKTPPVFTQPVPDLTVDRATVKHRQSSHQPVPDPTVDRARE